MLQLPGQLRQVALILMPARRAMLFRSGPEHDLFLPCRLLRTDAARSRRRTRDAKEDHQCQGAASLHLPEAVHVGLPSRVDESSMCARPRWSAVYCLSASVLLSRTGANIR